MSIEKYSTEAKQLQNHLQKLHQKRKSSKKPSARTGRLTERDRKHIFEKTDGRCHICGQKLTMDNFQADHVVSHVRRGSNRLDNYLPACFICNNYRWHYLPEELQLILKIGVWARTEIEKETTIGNTMAQKFVAKENRRKNAKARTKTLSK